MALFDRNRWHHHSEIATDYNPEITRLILTSSEPDFLSYKEYKYFYYFDKNIIEWGVYGGIKADSSTTKNYINVLNNVFAGKIKRIEKKFNLTLNDILLRSEVDSIFKQNVLSEYSLTSYEASYDYEGINILIDTSELRLKKINFEDAKLQGFQMFNFPINQQPDKYFFRRNFNDRSFIEDENVTQMEFIINTYSDKNL